MFFVISFLDVLRKTATVQHRIDIFWEWKLPIRFSLRRRAYNKKLIYLSFLIKSFLIKYSTLYISVSYTIFVISYFETAELLEY